MTTWYGLATNDTLTVRVGSAGAIETNTNVNAYDNVWVQRTSGTAENLYAVAWNGQYFVAVGANGTILRSADGVTWQAMTSGVGVDLNGVDTGGNVFIAVGAGGTILSSQTGASWTALASGTTETLWGVTIGNAMYTAVGDNNTIVSGNVVSTSLTVDLLESTLVGNTMVGNGVYQHAGSEDFWMDEMPTRTLDLADAYVHAFVKESVGVGNGIVQDKNGTDPQTGTSDAISNLDAVLTESLGLMADDSMIMTGAATGVPDFAYLYETVLAFQAGQPDAALLNAVDTDTVALHARLFDSFEKLMETLTVHAGLLEYVAILVSENVTVHSAAAVIQEFLQAVQEAVGVNEVLSASGAMGVTITDTTAGSDAVGSNLIADLLLKDQLFTGVTLQLPDATYTGWVINTQAGAPTEYAGFDFNSLCEFDDQYFGAKSDGVYLLEGNDDAGTAIGARIALGQEDFGSSYEKRIERGYMGVRNDGTLVLKVTTRESDGNLHERWYQMDQTGDTIRTERVKLPKGLKATYWQFELANAQGADFELDVLELVPVILTRRV